jgi:hypothetical protein
MAVSLIWSIDPPETVKALSKELPLLVFPLCFSVILLSRALISKVIRIYSYGMVAYGLFYIVKALFRYIETTNSDVFFYHELVTKEVNAIYISAMASVAFFYFLGQNQKKRKHYTALVFLLLFVMLLSSKNIIIIDVIIAAIYYGFYAPISHKAKVIAIVGVLAAVVAIGYFSKINGRITAELKAPIKERSVEGINNVTISEAYTLPRFLPNDYFNGTAFRVYQLRIFTEMMQEGTTALTGYGLNASLVRVKEKGVQYNVYQGKDNEEGYHMLNFHNQYIEIFADIGVFGFIIFIGIQAINLKNGFRREDFVHIAFAVLMISLFLTESFLWRQRGVVFFTMLYCLFNSNLSGYTKRTI